MVAYARVAYERETGRSRGFGFVTTSTRAELKGRILTVNKASARESRPKRPPPRPYEPVYRMYIGNLLWRVDNACLEWIFREYGRVVDASVVYERETGRSRGFSFVTTSIRAELNCAVTNLNGQNLNGREIKVNVAAERQRCTFCVELEEF